VICRGGSGKGGAGFVRQAGLASPAFIGKQLKHLGSSYKPEPTKSYPMGIGTTEQGLVATRNPPMAN